jgi:hypothetical protein
VLQGLLPPFLLNTKIRSSPVSSRKKKEFAGKKQSKSMMLIYMKEKQFRKAKWHDNLDETLYDYITSISILHVAIAFKLELLT